MCIRRLSNSNNVATSLVLAEVSALLGAILVTQETQLPLTNRATRLEVTKCGTIPYVRYGFLLVSCSNFVRKMRRFCDIRLQKCRDIENRVKGP